MRTARASASRAVAILATAVLLGSGLVIAGPQAPAAAATVTVDPIGLPTAQINGVAWAQVIVSGTVYVAGEFSSARPAGASPGSQTVSRSNLLAYDLATGNLTSWAPKLTGAAYSIAASPDGTRIYVGGDFTKVNGVAQNRFVALSRSSGTRISGFNPNPNSTVRAIAATSSTIYLGGRFTSVAGNTRNRLAALSASSGGLLSWKVSATYQVDALVMSPDKSRLIVGGRFTTLNGVKAPGSGAVSASSGSVQSWAVNKIVTNYGYDAGIESLSTDGTLVYGSGFAFLGHNGGYGNLEGIFAANPSTGALVWLEDCHGDTYGVYAGPTTQVVYGVGHPHYCANIGGFGDSEWRFILAFTKSVTGTIKHNTVPNYYDFYGLPCPSVLNFFPKLVGGTYTGTGQAAWSVTGSGDYVTFAGEFVEVTGKKQQGLTRMKVSGSSSSNVASQPADSVAGALAPKVQQPATEPGVTEEQPPPANQPPVAEFTATSDGLTTSVDATASTSDPAQGSVSYGWDFGDGGLDTGKTASHGYAAAGTYPVTLTVVDAAGATASIKHTVTVTAPAPTVAVSDTFERTVADGFGAPDVGGAWAATPGATSVADGTGRLTLATGGSTAEAVLASPAGSALRTQLTESWDQRPDGAGGALAVRGRITAGGEYRLIVGHEPSGAVSAQLVRTAADGTETVLTPPAAVPGLQYEAGTRLAVVLEVSGTWPTTSRANVWAAGEPEPASWLLTATDATAALQGPGQVGLMASLSHSSIGGPVRVGVDDVSVRDVG